MRVGIDATCWSNERGYGRYARNLINAILAESSHHDFILFIDSPTYHTWPLPDHDHYVIIETAHAPSHTATARTSRSLRDLWLMARTVSQTSLDVLYYPSVYTYFPVLTDAIILLGIHDTIADKYARLVFPDPGHRRLWQIKNWLGRRQADHIVTVSDYAKMEITDVLGWPAERVHVVGEAPESSFQPVNDRGELEQTLIRLGLDPEERFIICLGGLNPHKNLTMLVEVFAGLRQHPSFANLRLVFVGPVRSDSFTPGAGQVQQAVTRLGLDPAVLFTDFISDVEVNHLLNAALLLIMPSLEEGFGLGAVEAAACGTPVIATQNSPLPSLLEGGGLFIDPYHPQELHEALVSLLSDEARRQQMGRGALKQAQKLTWTRAARQFLTMLDAICPQAASA